MGEERELITQLSHLPYLTVDAKIPSYEVFKKVYFNNIENNNDLKTRLLWLNYLDEQYPEYMLHYRQDKDNKRASLFASDIAKRRDRVAPYLYPLALGPAAYYLGLNGLPYIAPGTTGGNFVGNLTAGMLAANAVDQASKITTGYTWGQNVSNLFSQIPGTQYAPDWLKGLGNEAAEFTNPGWFVGGLARPIGAGINKATKTANNILNKYTFYKNNLDLTGDLSKITDATGYTRLYRVLPTNPVFNAEAAANGIEQLPYAGKWFTTDPKKVHLYGHNALRGRNPAKSVELQYVDIPTDQLQKYEAGKLVPENFDFEPEDYIIPFDILRNTVPLPDFSKNYMLSREYIRKIIEDFKQKDNFSNPDIRYFSNHIFGDTFIELPLAKGGDAVAQLLERLQKGSGNKLKIGENGLLYIANNSNRHITILPTDQAELFIQHLIKNGMTRKLAIQKLQTQFGYGAITKSGLNKNGQFVTDMTLLPELFAITNPDYVKAHDLIHSMYRFDPKFKIPGAEGLDPNEVVAIVSGEIKPRFGLKYNEELTEEMLDEWLSTTDSKLTNRYNFKESIKDKKSFLKWVNKVAPVLFTSAAILSHE